MEQIQQILNPQSKIYEIPPPKVRIKTARMWARIEKVHSLIHSHCTSQHYVEEQTFQSQHIYSNKLALKANLIIA